MCARSAGLGVGADAGLGRGEGGVGMAVSLTKSGEIGNWAIAGRDGDIKRNFCFWYGDTRIGRADGQSGKALKRGLKKGRATGLC